MGRHCKQTRETKDRLISDIILITENCFAHFNDLSYSNVKVQFFLVKKTSHLKI